MKTVDGKKTQRQKSGVDTACSVIDTTRLECGEHVRDRKTEKDEKERKQ